MYKKNILDFIESFKTTKKEDVIRTMTIIFTSLKDTVVPMVTDMIESCDDIEEIHNSELLKHMFTFARIEGKSTKDKLIAFKNIIENVRSQEDDINVLIDRLPDVIDVNAIDGDSLGIINILQRIGTLAVYVPDLLLVVITSNHPTLLRLKIKEVNDGLSDFITLLMYIKDTMPHDIKKLLNNKHGEIYDILSLPSSLYNNIFGSVSVWNSAINSFIGNPIFHIRMWIVDREIEKYEALKARKKILEGRILELRLGKDATSDKSKKAIEVFEKDILKIEDKIHKIEED